MSYIYSYFLDIIFICNFICDVPGNRDNQEKRNQIDGMEKLPGRTVPFSCLLILKAFFF